MLLTIDEEQATYLALARDAYNAALANSNAPGVVAQARLLFSILQPNDKGNILSPIDMQLTTAK